MWNKLKCGWKKMPNSNTAPIRSFCWTAGQWTWVEKQKAIWQNIVGMFLYGISRPAWLEKIKRCELLDVTLLHCLTVYYRYTYISLCHLVRINESGIRKLLSSYVSQSAAVLSPASYFTEKKSIPWNIWMVK